MNSSRNPQILQLLSNWHPMAYKIPTVIDDGKFINSIFINTKARSLLSSTDSGRNPVLYPARDIPYGMHGMGGGFLGMGMDSMEWGMDSILFQDGFHGMGDGLHTFSRWNPWNGGWTQ